MRGPERPGLLGATALALQGSRRVASSARRAPEPALSAASRTRAGGTGRLLPLALIGAAGLFVVSVAFSLSRSDPQSGWAQLLFWVGLALIVLPPAARLLGAGAGRAERLGLALTVGVLLYLVKIIHDPFGFTYADEWVHVYNAQQILGSGALFHANPIIGVTSRYPGLESVTAAVASLTHLGLFASGAIVLGAARILFVLAFFLLVELITGSARIAGVAVLVYAANPNFLFWSAEFSYESIALPLALFAFFAAVRSRRSPGAGGEVVAAGPAHPLRRVLSSGRASWTALACLASAATAMSHHLTAFALCGFLVVVCLIASARRSTRGEAPWLVAGFAVTVTVAWVSGVAPGTGHYLFPVLARAFHQTVATVLGHSSGRGLFGGGSAGQPVAPVWQRLAALGSVGLIVLALPFGLVEARRRYLRQPVVVMLAAAAVIYVAVLPMRLVPAAWETSNRSSEFLFLGVALVLALSPPRAGSARASSPSQPVRSSACSSSEGSWRGGRPESCWRSPTAVRHRRGRRSSPSLQRPRAGRAPTWARATASSPPRQSGGSCS